MQKTIESERLFLRPFQQADQFALFEILSDRETCYADGGYAPFSRMDSAYAALMHKFATEEGRYIIVLKSSGKPIGAVHLMPVDNRAVLACEIGYLVHPAYRRRGYAAEAIQAVVAACFAAGCQLMTASAYAFNTPSMRLLEKVGFVKEGITHKAVRHCKYGVVDMVHYSKANAHEDKSAI